MPYIGQTVQAYFKDSNQRRQGPAAGLITKVVSDTRVAVVVFPSWDRRLRFGEIGGMQGVAEFYEELDPKTRNERIRQDPNENVTLVTPARPDKPAKTKKAPPKPQPKAEAKAETKAETKAEAKPWDQGKDPS